MMHCPSCGAPNSDGGAFCTSCGRALSAPPDGPVSDLLLAGRGTRFVAKVIDIAALIFLVVLVVFFLALSDTLLVIAMLVLLAYPIVQVVLLMQYGQTIGKRLVGIRIVMASTGENGGFVPNVLLRAWLNFIISIIPLYGLVDVLFIFREDRRCIHDLIAGTRVVR